MTCTITKGSVLLNQIISIKGAIMDVITVNNRQVIKCVHCNGSGICSHSDHLFVERSFGGQQRQGWVLSCPKCGEGVFKEGILQYRWFGGPLNHSPEKKSMKPPVCGVCGGMGHVTIG